MSVIRRWKITTSYPVDETAEGGDRYIMGATVYGPEQREQIEVVPLTDYRGAVEALREIKRVAAIEAPPVSDEVPAKVWKIAFDALRALEGGQ